MQMQIVNRGLTPGPVRGGSPLWRYFASIQVQRSILIYNNGDVWEKASFTDKQIADPNVHTFIYGGTDFRCEDDSFEYEALLAQGYEFREVPEE